MAFSIGTLRQVTWGSLSFHFWESGTPSPNAWGLGHSGKWPL